jgi:hypothetical protein
MGAEEILKSMIESGFKPTENEDSSGFKPFSGEYQAVVHKVERRTGKKADGSEYDFISVSAQVEETLSGDPANGRYIDGMIFSLTNEWGLPSFVNTCFTAGVELDKSNIPALLESAQALVGKVVNVRTWEKNGYQSSKVVKTFKEKKKAAAEASSF